MSANGSCCFSTSTDSSTVVLLPVAVYYKLDLPALLTVYKLASNIDVADVEQQVQDYIRQEVRRNRRLTPGRAQCWLVAASAAAAAATFGVWSNPVRFRTAEHCLATTAALMAAEAFRLQFHAAACVLVADDCRITLGDVLLLQAALAGVAAGPADGAPAYM